LNKKKQIFLAFWNVLQLTMGQNDEKIDMKLVIAWFQHTKSLMDINFQQLYEQNTSLKEIIIKLDTKVEELSKSRHDLTEAVSAKKSSTFNTPIFNAPTLNAPMANVSDPPLFPKRRSADCASCTDPARFPCWSWMG
jgi:sulfur relay (sulfurtransferase) DsrF/TusC family protein